MKLGREALACPTSRNFGQLLRSKHACPSYSITIFISVPLAAFIFFYLSVHWSCSYTECLKNSIVLPCASRGEPDFPHTWEVPNTVRNSLCSGHFSCCSVQSIHKSKLRKGFILTRSLRWYSPSWWGRQGGRGHSYKTVCSHLTGPESREKGCFARLISSFALFIQLLTLSHGAPTPYPPRSLNHLWKSPHRCTKALLMCVH